MASNFFQNNTSDLNQLWFDSHKKLIKRVTTELGQLDKYEELVDKFLGKQLKIKKQKDPNMPKRSKSSFLYFCDAHRASVKNKHKDFKMGEVMKELGKMWKECKPKEKEKFIKMSQEAKSDYNDKLEEYNLNNCYE